MGAGTKVQSTRVKGIRIFCTVDLSQWILERYYRGPESMGSVTIVQSNSFNGFWNYMYYRRPESMGPGTIVQ